MTELTSIETTGHGYDDGRHHSDAADSPDSATRHSDWTRFLKSDEELRTTRKKVRNFYALQNDYINTVNGWRSQISRMHQMKHGTHTALSDHDPAAPPPGVPGSESVSDGEEGELKGRAHGALILSFWCNVLLLGVRVTATVFTPSLLMITACVDGSLDLLSGAILFLTAKIMRQKNKDIYNYPVGVSRMEPLGILAFACVMATAAAQIVQEGVVRLANGDIPPTPALITFILLGVNVLVKFALWLYCRALSSVSASVEAVADDHRNDVLSSFMIAMGMFTSEYVWWLDAVGACLLALWIIRNWFGTSVENIQALSGGAAPPDMQRLLTYIVAHHDPRIQQVDTVRAYRMGVYFWVECDIVLGPETPLREAHDIGESLQKTLEKVQDVERAFVHLDFETDHDPNSEHQRL